MGVVCGGGGGGGYQLKYVLQSDGQKKDEERFLDMGIQTLESLRMTRVLEIKNC